MSGKTCGAVTVKFLGLGGVVLLVLWLLSFFQFHGGRVSWGNPAAAAGGELPAQPPGTAALVERLRRTNLLNGDEILDQLNLEGNATQPEESDASLAQRRGGFLTHNPFKPRYRESYASRAALRYPLPDDARSYNLDERNKTLLFYGQEPVLRWYSSLRSNTEVCAVGFVDSDRVDYRLRTFPDRERALREGYHITHRYHCGTCSSLRDLAVYLVKPDLMSPARTCGRKLTAGGIKACLMQEIGLEERCAETWTYNVLHTRRRCAGTCIEHYGLWNVLTNNMGDAHADKRGNLNPCLACDEYISGPGFQYAAGRTRRNSGLTSAIHRPPSEIFPVDHRRYFE